MKEIVGLDMGSHTIKMVVLKKTSKGPLLTRLGMKEIPLNLDPGDIPAMAYLLKDLAEEMGLKTKKVSLTFSCPDLQIRRLTLPSIPNDELKEAISWEMKEQLPFPIETTQIDFHILREWMEEEVKKVELLTMACPKERIERTLSIVKEAGLEAIHVEATPISLWNAMINLGRLKGEERIALIDLGAEKTHLYLFENGILVFNRVISPGGKDITQTLLDEILGLTYEQAEKIKKEIGIALRKSPVESSAMAKESFVMRPAFERLVSEIGRSIEFYRNQFIVEKIDKILLTGGGAHLKNIIPYFEEELRLRIEPFNPLQGLLYEAEKMDQALLSLGESFSPAIGATFSKPISIEFLAVKEPFLSRNQLKKRTPLMVAFVASLIFFILITNTEIQLRRLGQQREEKMAKIKDLENIKTSLLLLKQREAKIREERAFFPSPAESSFSYQEILKEISEILPNPVTLHLLEIQTEDKSPQKDVQSTPTPLLRLSGFVFGNEVQSLQTLAQLIERLERSTLFNHIRLISAEENKSFNQKASAFEILCHLAIHPKGGMRLNEAKK
jgi:type IV pilus assembly protein PilM